MCDALSLTVHMVAAMAASGAVPTPMISEIVQSIADMGVMIVIAAVTIVFLIRVMDTLLQQSKQANAEILPRLSSCVETILAAKTSIVETLGAHNMSSNKKLYNLEVSITSLQTGIDHLGDQYQTAENRQHDILIQLEKLEGLIYAMRAELGIRDEVPTAQSKNIPIETNQDKDRS